MGRIRGVYAKPWSDRLDVKVTPDLLHKMGRAIVKRLSEESRKDFAKRGWVGRDPMGGPDVWDSFSYRIHESSVEILSTFYGMAELTTGDIPSRRMVWLTQQGAGKVSSVSAGGKPKYKLGQRPLVVPIKEKSGEVVFRTAPLQLKDAWIHPGIAKYTFVQRAINKAKEDCKQLVVDAIQDAFSGKN